MTKKYYTSKEVENGIDGLPAIKENTLRSLRQNRKIKYTKIGKECVYQKEWIEKYIESNIVETI